MKKDEGRLEVLGDGRQVRSYIYVDDAVGATMTAYEKAKGIFEAYKVASGNWMTVDGMVETVLRELGLDSVEIVHKPVLHRIGRPGDVKRVALKIDKLKILGFKPAMRSEGAIIKTIKDLQNEGLI